MLQKLSGGSALPAAGSGPIAPPPPPPPPPAPPAEEAKKAEGDHNAVAAAEGKKSTVELPGQKKDDKKTYPNNPLWNSPGRTAADTTSTAADVAETAKDARGIAGLFTSVGSRFSRLSRLTAGVATGLEWVADKGGAIGRAAPTVAKGFAGLAKAAPFIGVGMAGLDIGKAIMEKDPEKKQIAKGTAAFSTFSSAASIGGTALLATQLAPLGVGLIAAGVTASVVSFVDTTFFGGKVSKVVGGAVDAVADVGKKAVEGVKKVGEGIGNAAKSVWHGLSSL
jgi:hypothetical protein